MGCCCSCIGGGDDGSPTGASETEMQEQELADRKILSIARGMSAPSIEVEDFNKVCDDSWRAAPMYCNVECVARALFLC